MSSVQTALLGRTTGRAAAGVESLTLYRLALWTCWPAISSPAGACSGTSSGTCGSDAIRSGFPRTS